MRNLEPNLAEFKRFNATRKVRKTERIIFVFGLIALLHFCTTDTYFLSFIVFLPSSILSSPHFSSRPPSSHISSLLPSLPPSLPLHTHTHTHTHTLTHPLTLLYFLFSLSSRQRRRQYWQRRGSLNSDPWKTVKQSAHSSFVSFVHAYFSPFLNTDFSLLLSLFLIVSMMLSI